MNRMNVTIAVVGWDTTIYINAAPSSRTVVQVVRDVRNAMMSVSDMRELFVRRMLDTLDAGCCTCTINDYPICTGYEKEPGMFVLVDIRNELVEFIHNGQTRDYSFEACKAAMPSYISTELLNTALGDG